MRKISVGGRLSGVRLLTLLFCVFILALRSAAQLGERSQASLITLSPGDPVYTTFGHSAIRVSDPALGLDRCYNYGTFDFEQPGFLLKFCRGKLNYFLDTEPFRYTERGALLERRVLDEQVLNFTLEERQRLYELLETNALELIATIFTTFSTTIALRAYGILSRKAWDIISYLTRRTYPTASR